MMLASLAILLARHALRLHAASSPFPGELQEAAAAAAAAAAATVAAAVAFTPGLTSLWLQ